jgi:HSP20 family molecular chaperone IbpA
MEGLGAEDLALLVGAGQLVIIGRHQVGAECPASIQILRILDLATNVGPHSVSAQVSRSTLEITFPKPEKVMTASA